MEIFNKETLDEYIRRLKNITGPEIDKETLSPTDFEIYGAALVLQKSLLFMKDADIQPNDVINDISLVSSGLVGYYFDENRQDINQELLSSVQNVANPLWSTILFSDMEQEALV